MLKARMSQLIVATLLGAAGAAHAMPSEAEEVRGSYSSEQRMESEARYGQRAEDNERYAAGSVDAPVGSSMSVGTGEGGFASDEPQIDD